MSRRHPAGATALMDRRPATDDDVPATEPAVTRRARWWRGWRRVVPVTVAVLLVAGLAVGTWWLLWVSTVLSTRTVRVEGTTVARSVQVSRAAAVATGGPLMAMDTRAIGGRVLGVPGVAGVRVTRHLPHTITIEVTERVPVAVLRSTGGQLRLVDADATVWVPPGAVPASLPVLVDRDGTLDAGAVDTAVRVSSALPTALHTRVRALVAASPGSVLLVLAGGRVVVWGGPDDAAEKTRVATALLGATRADYVDVSVPTAPVTRTRVQAGLVPAF